LSLLYMIRHGQASFGQGRYDRLSETGSAQAEILGDYFRDSGMKFHFACSGEMSRQKETGRIALSRMDSGATDLELSIVSAFNEYDADEVIRRQMNQMVAEDPRMAEDFTKFFTDNHSFQRVLSRALWGWVSGALDTTGMESWEEFKNRVWSGICRIREEYRGGKTVVVFTSGGAITVATGLALGLPDNATVNLIFQIANASVTVFRYDRDRFTLSSFNETAHLHMRADPRLVTHR